MIRLFADSVKQRVDQGLGPSADTCSFAVSGRPGVGVGGWGGVLLTGFHPPVLFINTVHLLTQVCVVWRFINSVSADGIAGGLQLLDPHGIMTAFSICLTPPASKPEIY